MTHAAQTEGLATETPRDGTAPEPAGDELATTMPDVTLTPDTFSSINDDLLADVPGVDALPEDQRKATRDAILKKFTELDQEKQRTQALHQQYLEAIQNAQAQNHTAPETAEDLEGMSPQQIVQHLAAKEAEKIYEQKMKQSGVSNVSGRLTQLQRQLQLAEAYAHYPDLHNYAPILKQMTGELESRMDPEAAANLLSVTDMMDIIKARAQRRTRGQKPPATQRAAKPVVPPQTHSQSPSGVTPQNSFETTWDAFMAAKKMHGIAGEFRDNPNG